MTVISTPADKFTESLTQDGRYRLLVEAVTDYAIYMLDPNGVITSWNPGAERFKGYSQSEIIGTNFSRFYTDEDQKSGKPQQALATAAREGKFEAEGWRVRKDGTRFWAYVVIDPIKSPSGEIVGYAKVTRDLTERRKNEEQLERAKDALRQSQKMEAIGQLTGGIAHDFNNLLMAILGSLELVRKRLPDDPKISSLIDNAIQGAERGRSLTQRMLAFARRQALEPVPVDLGPLVFGMSELLQRSLGPTIKIETRFPLSLDRVCADPNQLELAILNLAVNARDAMDGVGELVISASAETIAADSELQLPPGVYVCLRFRDQGVGMDEHTLARATEPFFTTKGVGKGTGLGLSMVHGMAEQLGGRLRLVSRKGEGTTAEIWLPVTTAPPTEEKGLSSAEPQVQTARLKILAVDDDALVLMNTVAMLEDLGHAVVDASSGQEAIKLLAQHSDVNLVITDQAMPGLSGLALAQVIAEKWPAVKVLVATGYTELPAGRVAIPMISKPFTQKELASAIANLRM